MTRTFSRFANTRLVPCLHIRRYRERSNAFMRRIYRIQAEDLLRNFGRVIMPQPSSELQAVAVSLGDAPRGRTQAKVSIRAPGRAAPEQKTRRTTTPVGAGAFDVDHSASRSTDLIIRRQRPTRYHLVFHAVSYCLDWVVGAGWMGGRWVSGLDRWMDGWMSGWMGVRGMNEWMDGWLVG